MTGEPAAETGAAGVAVSTARSFLYVPGTRPDLVGKALAGPADAVVLDLEDAVPPEGKERARAAAAEVTAEPQAKPVWVRVNALDSPWARDDVTAVARPGSAGSPGLTGVRIPKCEAPESVRTVADWLERVGSPARLHPLLESALGVERAFEIVTAGPRVALVALGEADLRASLGLGGGASDGGADGLAYPRSRLVVAARAADLPGPVHSVHTRLRDPEGLRASTRAGRELGFSGRSAIHPEQVDVINEVFTPTGDEVARARDLLAFLEGAVAEGSATLVTGDGQFVDPAVVAAARQTLALTDRAETANQNRPEPEPTEPTP